MVDAQEDARLARPLDDPPERVDLLGRRCREPRLPEARDPDGTEAGLFELAERRTGMADGVVDRADEERRVLASAAPAAGGDCQRRKGERTANSALERTTTIPGRVAWTNVTESL